MMFRSSTPATVHPIRHLILLTFLLSPAWTSAQSDPLAAFNDALEKVVSKVAPAVVEVEAIVPPQRSALNSNDSQEIERRLEHAIGTGVIVDPSGYIVTNAHVVDKASTITVSLDQRWSTSNGNSTGHHPRSSLKAQVIGEFKEADLAVIKVDAEGLPTLPLTFENTPRQGELVIAFGSPEGLRNSVSLGIVSSPGQQITPDSHLLYIQTDAAINPGNSGGPLVDRQGNLIGINTFFMTQGGGSEGLGFAIPSHLVNFIYETLRKNGEVIWPDPGIRVQGITAALAEGLSLPRESGVVVSDVAPGAVAQTSGIRARDVIISLDGRPIDNVPEYYELLYHKPVGDLLTISLLRDSLIVNVRMKVAAWGSNQWKSGIEPEPDISFVPKLGVLCSELASRPPGETPNFRSHIGILVEAKAVTGDKDLELSAGDVILAVNLTRVTGIKQLQSVLDTVKPGTPIVLRVERNSQFIYVPIDAN